MCKIELLNNISTVTSYYVTAAFDLPSESKSRYTMYPNLDF